MVGECIPVSMVKHETPIMYIYFFLLLFRTFIIELPINLRKNRKTDTTYKPKIDPSFGFLAIWKISWFFMREFQIYGGIFFFSILAGAIESINAVRVFLIVPNKWEKKINIWDGFLKNIAHKFTIFLKTMRILVIGWNEFELFSFPNMLE